MPTVHIESKRDEIADIVLMPGDPNRSEYIAKKYLKNYKLVNSVRGMLAYTGYYKDRLITIFPSGMGNPSMGIYSYELYKFYDVENIIRIGSAGAYTDKLKVLDVVLADAVWSESTYGQAQSLDMKNWQYPSEELNRQIKDTALKMNKKLVSGPIHSSDVFYHEADANDVLRKMVDEEGLLCVEMESFALFHNAEVLGRNAACLLTISDSLVTGEELDADARATAFAEMVELALEAAIAV